MKTPEQLIQEQVQAYNDRDLARFLSFYSQDAVLYNLDTGDTISRGHAEMEPKYARLFQNASLHCRIENRIVLGGTVVDQECVTVDAGGTVIRAIAIYETAHGLIQRVWFSYGGSTT